jgi:transcriptional regulator with XRE-family HTH domain
MKLAEYLTRHNITQAAFADMIEMSVASVSRIANGLQRPDLDTLLAIKRATRGKVGLDDFADSAP